MGEAACALKRRNVRAPGVSRLTCATAPLPAAELGSLCDDLQLSIFRQLLPKDQARLACCSRRLNALGKPLGSALVHAVKCLDVARTRQLLTSGADVNAWNNAFQSSPLHIAAAGAGATGERSHIQLMLLAAGADVNARNVQGLTPLHYAAKFGDETSVSNLLLAGADLEATSHDMETPLALAAFAGRTHSVAQLLKAGAAVNAPQWQSGTSIVHWVALSGQLSVLKQLLEAGASLSETSIGGATLLHFAAAGGSLAVVDFLLESGAAVGAADLQGETALFVAAKSGQATIVERLLQAGADVNSATSSGCTALATASTLGYAAIVDLLLQGGADVSARSLPTGETALPVVAAEGQTAAVADLAAEAGHPAVVEQLQAPRAARCRSLGGSARTQGGGAASQEPVVAVGAKRKPAGWGPQTASKRHACPRGWRPASCTASSGRKRRPEAGNDGARPVQRQRITAEFGQ